MNRYTVGILAAIAAIVLTVPAGAQKKTEADTMFEAARQKETLEGDLKGAIKQYGAIVAKYKNDRAVTAQALIRMADAYQKMGDAEARKIYEQVVREYGDQKDAVALARTRLGGSAKPQNAGIVTRQVWTGPKVDTNGAVSPDGRFLSFTDWSTGDLALHDLTTGQDRRVTNRGTSAEYAFGSAFSPDAKQVAYVWSVLKFAGKELFVELRLIDLNGGKPRVLFTNHDVEWITLHDWSPDGKWLAVQLQRADRTSQIALVSTVDGSLRVLRSIDWRGASKMAFSPDVKYLAYDLPASEGSEQRDIYLMAADGSRETPTVVHPANDRVLGWSPDSNHVLFASDRSGSNGVWALPIRDGRPQGGPESTKLVKADLNPRAVGLTRSGALYYFAQSGGVDVYVASVDFETGKVLSPPAMIAQQNVGFNDSPNWSPDGKSLAYLTYPNRNLKQGTVLAIRSMETGKVRELRPNLAYFGSSSYTWGPLWSADGTSLVVNGADKKGRLGIYRIDQQSGEATPLVLQESGRGNPSAKGFSPDGKTLFIARKEVSSQKDVLVAHDMQSGNEREVVRLDQLYGVAVSRDGRLLAITGFDRSTKSGSLLLVPVEGGDSRELLNLSGSETMGTFVAWSPDGKFLLFRKGPGVARETFRIPVEGGTPAKYGAEWTGGPPTINPDGRQVAFQKGQPKFEVWVLENFLSGLQAKQ